MSLYIRKVADSCTLGIFIWDTNGIFHCDSMKHKVILHWLKLKLAVSRMKMPHVREFATSLICMTVPESSVWVYLEAKMWPHINKLKTNWTLLKSCLPIMYQVHPRCFTTQCLHAPRSTHDALKHNAFKLNSYSNASVFPSLCRMRISVFWGQERLTDWLISKRYLKSDIATWVEKSSTSSAIHACDTGFYWSSENALHERFIASSGVGVWIKMLQLIAKW